MDNKYFPRFLRSCLYMAVVSILLFACSSENQIGNENQLTGTILAPVKNTEIPSLSPTYQATIPGAVNSTPTLISTQMSTHTSAPSKTYTPTTTVSDPSEYPILEPLSGEPLILYIDMTHRYVYIQNILTGEAWPVIPLWEGKFDHEIHRGYLFVAWSHEGCEIILRDDQIGGNLIRSDLRGEVTQELIAYDDINPHASITDIVLSSSENFIAVEGIEDYYRDEGEETTRAFLEVINLNDITKRQRLSENNVPTLGLLGWSPDEEWLAYAEEDTQDVIQLIISRPDGSSRQQITHLTDPKANLYDLKWSPDDRKIAFVYDEIYDQPGTALAFVDLDDLEPIEVKFISIEGVHTIMDFWWQNETILTIRSGSLYWFDIASEEVVDTLQVLDVPEQYIISALPFNNSPLIGLFSNTTSNFYIYDANTKKLERFPNAGQLFENDIQYWKPVPANFSGEKACKP